MTIKTIKKNLKEAREKGWWIACLYWERKLEHRTTADKKH